MLAAAGAWTDERIAALVEMSADGLSAGQIAARLGGVSRNAVIGKLNRLHRGQPPRETRRVRLRPPAPARSIAQPAAAAHEAHGAPQSRGRAVEFLALDGDMCRWPIGDPASDEFGFCGETIGSGSYCQRHAGLARLRRR